MKNKLNEEFKKKLIEEGIETLNIVSFNTVNDKYKKTLITTIKLIEGTERKLIDYTWYASRKNKQW